MVVPGYKVLFFLRSRPVKTEEFGQKCELMDRKGQNSRLLFASNSGAYPRRVLPETCLMRGLDKLIFLLFQPLLQITRRHIATPQAKS
jgi:hypothetical protein